MTHDGYNVGERHFDKGVPGPEGERRQDPGEHRYRDPTCREMRHRILGHSFYGRSSMRTAYALNGDISNSTLRNECGEFPSSQNVRWLLLVATRRVRMSV